MKAIDAPGPQHRDDPVHRDRIPEAQRRGFVGYAKQKRATAIQCCACAPQQGILRAVVEVMQHVEDDDGVDRVEALAADVAADETRDAV